eukprot:TRINITY_DN44674_c0_g1_i1.p2 TRINITY_DN44674_c0_g1~~TRINITY_DN44674_c0_g1_i1.p2  ORF type:complete len:108 (+),score=41.36 TRINITY_DN44674_c0_g1_i1:88-411(+)
MVSEEEFKRTVEFVRTWEEGKSAEPDVLAESYALFKQATVGDASGEPPEDESKKAKFEAWGSKKGMSKEDAMSAYVKFIDEKKAELGVEGKTTAPGDVEKKAEVGGA